MSNQWGSFFTDAGTTEDGPCKDYDHCFNNVLDGFFVCNKAKERREMNTFWGDVIQRYSTITIPRIDFITGNFPPVWIMSMSIVNVTQELSCFQMYNKNVIVGHGCRTLQWNPTLQPPRYYSHFFLVQQNGQDYIALEKSLVNAVTPPWGTQI